MSLGWSTESALLPSKSKTIKVDSRSMVGLKSMVYEKEQQVEMGLEVKEGRGDGKKEKDPFKRANKGVEDREKRDTMWDKPSSKKLKRTRALQAKERLYRRLAAGDGGEAAEREGLLVNFEAKRYNDEEYADSGSDLSDDGDGSEVEIQDEFGRERRVRRGSRAHKDWVQEKKRRREDERREAEEKRKAEKAEKSRAARVAAASSTGEWAWGTGNEGEGGAKRKREDVGDLMAEVAGGEKGGQIGGGVKSQWDVKTMKGTTREFLEEIHKDTEKRRASSGTTGTTGTTGTSDGTAMASIGQGKSKLMMRRQKAQERLAKIKAAQEEANA
ncbi:unnamed protein product [Chrysoparadoxa australica]